jgi:hypothetical protein
MSHTFAELVHASVLSARISDKTLASVESDFDCSTYTYKCGCVAVREADSGDCLVRWCSDHRKV